jgi:hypothetical protein
MAVKFTPGPWRLEGPDGFGDYNVLESASDPVVAAVISNVRLASEVNANARLIASAPELLEALKRVVVLAELVTIRQIIQAGDDAIKAAGLNPWCINEGLATGDETHSVLFAHAAIIKAESRT